MEFVACGKAREIEPNETNEKLKPYRKFVNVRKNEILKSVKYLCNSQSWVFIQMRCIKLVYIYRENVDPKLAHLSICTAPFY